MSPYSEILIEIYKEQWSQGRQTEGQRATITNIITTLAMFAFGFIAQQRFAISTLPVAIFILVLGIYGAVVSSVMYARFKMHSDMAMIVLKELNKFNTEGNISELFEKSSEVNEKKFPRTSRIHLSGLWRLLHIIVSIIGLASCIIIVYVNFLS